MQVYPSSFLTNMSHHFKWKIQS